MMTYFQNRKMAFYIALIYVGFGTLSVCSIYPSDYFYGDWTFIGLLITFPVTFISFGYRYSESEVLYPVFIIQIVMFFLTFLILGTVLKKKKKF